MKKNKNLKNQQTLEQFFKNKKTGEINDQNLIQKDIIDLNLNKTHTENHNNKKQTINQENTLRQKNLDLISKLQKKHNICQKQQDDQPLIKDLTYIGYNKKIVKFSELYIVHPQQDKEQFLLNQHSIRKYISDPWTKIQYVKHPDIRDDANSKKSIENITLKNTDNQKCVLDVEKINKEFNLPSNNISIDFNTIYKKMIASRKLHNDPLLQPQKKNSQKQAITTKLKNKQSKFKINHQQQKQKNYLDDFEFDSLSESQEEDYTIQNLNEKQISNTNFTSQKQQLFKNDSEKNILNTFLQKYQYKIKNTFINRKDQDIFKCIRINITHKQNMNSHINKKTLILEEIQNKIFKQFPFIDKNEQYIRSIIDNQQTLAKLKPRRKIKQKQSLNFSIKNYDDIMSLQCSINTRRLILHHSPYSIFLKNQNILVKSDIKDIYRQKIYRIVNLRKIFNYFKNKNIHILRKDTKKSFNNPPQDFLDLSLETDNFILIEYIEQNPLILSIKGMNSQIINYEFKTNYEKENYFSTNNQNFELGKKMDGQNCKSFLSELVFSQIKRCQAVENNLSISPIYKQEQKQNNGDFLLIIRTKYNQTDMFLRKIQRVYTAGQIEPKQKLLWPFSEKTRKIQESYFKYISVIELFNKKQINLETIRQIFPHIAMQKEKIGLLIERNKDLQKYLYLQNNNIFLQQLANTNFNIEKFCLLQKMESTYYKFKQLFQGILNDKYFTILIQNKNMNSFMFESLQNTKDQTKRFILFKIYESLNQLSWVRGQNFFQFQDISNLDENFQNEIFLNYQVRTNSIYYKFLHKEKKKNILDEQRVTDILVEHFNLTKKYLQGKSRYWKKVLLGQELKSLMNGEEKDVNKLVSMSQKSKDIKNFCAYLKEKSLKKKNTDLKKVQLVLQKFEIVYNWISNKLNQKDFEQIISQEENQLLKFNHIIHCYSTWDEEAQLIEYNKNLLKIQNKSKSKQKQKTMKENKKQQKNNLEPIQEIQSNDISNSSSSENQNFELHKELEKQYNQSDNKKRQSKRLKKQLLQKSKSKSKENQSQQKINEAIEIYQNSESSHSNIQIKESIKYNKNQQQRTIPQRIINDQQTLIDDYKNNLVIVSSSSQDIQNSIQIDINKDN